MFGLVRKNTAERLLREVLAERERLVQTLVEQLQHCRALRDEPTLTVQRAAQGEVPVPYADFEAKDDTPIEVRDVASDDVDELDAMLQARVISKEEYDRAMTALESPSPDSIIE